MLGAFAAMAVVSCQKNDIQQDSSKTITLLTATSGEMDTKTSIDDESLDISWSSGDEINVFFGASESSLFVTENSGEVAQFKGQISVVTGGGDGLTDDTSLWGIYPYDSGNTCDGTSVTLTLPATQTAAENTFANGLFPQIARSRNFYMSFYNLCGCFRFSVSNNDITSVTLSGNAQEAVAGKVKVSMETTPAVEEHITQETVITMNAPDGGCFKPGVNYYLVVFPHTFKNGLTLTYYKKDSQASYTYSKQYTLERGKFSSFTNRDAGLTFESASCKHSAIENGYCTECGELVEIVDLGLSVKWGTCNVGADTPDGYGNLYSWAEASPKESYKNTYYTHGLGTADSPCTKYCTVESCGTVDNKTVIEPSDDAVAVTKGGDWRMPTRDEFKELLTECEWEWITLNGTGGMKVTSSTNGNSIFLPAGGRSFNTTNSSKGSKGYYWTSTLVTESSVSTNNTITAFDIYFSSTGTYSEPQQTRRYYGESVRGVHP